MAETKMQEVVATTSEQQQQQTLHQDVNVEGFLEKYGGFAALKGFIPLSADMNPAKKATKAIFLTDNKFKAKRDNLAKELKSWLEILSLDSSVTGYADLCKEREEQYKKMLEQNVTIALDSIQQLETAYRSLDLFFKNAGSDKLNKLRLINVNRDELYNDHSELCNEVDKLLKDSYDRLSLKDNYSIMVIPGSQSGGITRGTFQNVDGVTDDPISKPTLLKWAKIAHKYKVLLVADHDKERTFDDLLDNTSGYKVAEKELQHVVVTGNWIVGRPKEALSTTEKDSDDAAFYIPSAAALAGKLYDENANMAQGAAGERYGTLCDVKGVKLDLLKSEIAALRGNSIIPIVYSEGRVMAWDNTTLYNGDNAALCQYPIVRVLDWVGKVLMNFVHKVAGENWDRFNSPKELKGKIQAFLDQYQGHGKLFESYSISDPVQDDKTKNILVNVSVKPYFAAKDFAIKISADKDNKSYETE